MNATNKQREYTSLRTKEDQEIREFLRSVGETKANILEKRSNFIVLIGQSGKKYYLVKQGEQYKEIRNVKNNEKKKEIQYTSIKSSQISPKTFQKMKSKKGTMHGKMTAMIFASGVMAAILISSLSQKQENTQTAISTVIDVLEENQMPIELLENRENDLKIEINEQYNMDIQPKITFQNIKISFQPESTMQRREMIEKPYGEEIKEVSERYGIPYAIAIALFSRESYEDLLNLGSLTSGVCKEQIVASIIKKEEEDIQQNREEDKIFIIQDEPKETSFKNYNDYIKALKDYKEQIETGKQLQKEGYEIYNFKDVISNPKLNIQISLAYLAHCIYKCDMDCNKGIRAYNGGYTTVRTLSDEDIANGVYETGDPFYNQHVYAYLYPEEQQMLSWTLRDPTTKKEMSIIMNIQNTMEKTNEQENGYSL